MKTKYLLIATVMIGLAATMGSVSVRAATYYVATNSAANGPGTSWANAFNTIQGAVNAAASGDTVLVTNGVYSAGATVTPGYVLTNRVCITNAITVQSVNGPTNTFIIGAGPWGAGAIRCVYMSAGVLAGFTLTNGYTRNSGDSDFDQSGGGAFLNSQGTVSNCVLTGCSSFYGGGGAECYEGGTMNNCTISANSAPDTGYGGGVYCNYGGTLNNCTMTTNSVSGAGWGGGAYCYYGGTLNNCTITTNSASGRGWGGGAFCDYGGTLNNCLLSGNLANGDGLGGGAFCNHGGTLNNCTISGNSAYDGGGDAGGVFCNGGTLNNCIVYFNVAGGAQEQDMDGYSYTVQYTCSPDLSGSGNIANDPQFVNAPAGNYQLSTGSPCINAGNNAYAQGATDLAGNPRIIGGTVDMGAYECLYPVVTITNTATSVPWTQTTIVIGGTNNQYVTGTMFYTNAANGAAGSFTAQPAWTTPAITLAYGANVLSVTGTNSVGAAASDSITITRAMPPAPVVTITNTATAVPWTQTTIVIGGTNNQYVTGTMFYTNAANGAAGSFTAQPAWTTPAITLAYGANVLSVTGTNSVGAAASDSITITRAMPPAPVVTITNTVTTVPGQSTIIGGTNNAYVTGTMFYTNAANGAAGSFTAQPAWTTPAITLAYGANVLSVTGTNSVGAAASASITITRPAPVVTITNTVTTVPWDQDTIVIGGTNNPSVTGTMFYTNAANGAAGSFTAQPAWTTPAITLAYGNNPVTVTGTNSVGLVASASITITRPAPSTVYVAPGGSNVWPYGSWANAATTIQAAVSAVATGGTVWVSNGLYSAGATVTPGYALTNRVCITNAITVQSVNGPAATFIVGAGPQGAGAVRCVYMSAGVLSGFTLTNGYTQTSGDVTYDQSGGGALLNSGGTVSNCLLTGCSTYRYGGGACCDNGGTLNNCTLSGNSAYEEGGGVFFVGGGTLNNCLLYGNTASYDGGGAYCNEGGTLNNCTISTNSAGGSGAGNGVSGYSSGTLNNCIVFGDNDNGNSDINGSGLTVQYTCSPGLSGSGCITNNPLFVNAAAGNYRLSGASPCINAGNIAYAQGATDLDGNPRTIGGTVDLGAYEHVAPPGQALDFNGTNAYVQIPDASSLKLTNNYTLEAWINVDSFNWLGGIISKYQVASANGYVLRLGGTAPYTGIGFDGMETATNLLGSNRWYHVAAVNSNGTRHLYLNGVEQTLTGTPLTIQTNNNVVSIGADYLVSPRYFDGKIDEVRIWSVVRTLDQIRDAMHQQLTGGEAGLAAYYNFNVSSGTLLPDLTTNSNNGTLVNGPVWTNSTFPCANLIADTNNLRGAWIAQTNSLAASILSISNAVVTGTDFRVFGHDGGPLTNNTPDKPAAFAWRLNRAWQVEGTGALTGDLVFDCTSITSLIQDTTQLRLLVDNDGTFANATAVAGTYAANAFIAAGQTLPQGGYYTIGEYAALTGLKFTANPVISGTSLTISATNTGAGTVYLLTSTNVAAPLDTWTPIWTNVLNGNGSFTTNLPNAVNPALNQQFYLLGNTNN